MENHIHHRSRESGVFLGVLLVLAGIGFLAAEFVPFDFGPYAWPLVLIALGFAFLVRAATRRNVS